MHRPRFFEVTPGIYSTLHMQQACTPKLAMCCLCIAQTFSHSQKCSALHMRQACTSLNAYSLRCTCGAQACKSLPVYSLRCVCGGQSGESLTVRAWATILMELMHQVQLAGASQQQPSYPPAVSAPAYKARGGSSARVGIDHLAVFTWFCVAWKSC